MEQKKEDSKDKMEIEQEKKDDIKQLEEIMYSTKIGDLNYDESLALAEKLKQEGNTFFQNNKFIEALEKYTDAINLKVETKNNAIYYSNRAFVNLKLENYGSAIEDVNMALKIDPNFSKAYQRRAEAYFSLRKYTECIKDYLYLKSKFPDNKSIDEKLERARKEKKKQNFFAAYSSEGRGTPQITIEKVLKDLQPNSSYKGPVFPEDGNITKEWVINLIEMMKDQENKKPYSEKYIDKLYLLRMLLKVKNIFMAQKEALIDINIPDDKKFTVVGDIHGQFYDLLHIFEINGYPDEENPYLFNGDYVDRGVFSLECLITLLAFKILYPNHFFMARGNHESVNLNQMYGFKNEVNDKYGKDERIYICFTEFFKSLPLGHILNKQVLVVHGGLFSKDGVTIEDIKKIDRFKEIPESGLMSELLWSDPCKENGRIPSKRGVGMSFGPDVAHKFLTENNLKLLIRSHEVKMNGYEVEPSKEVITIFSAPNYCDQMGNKGAIINFTAKKDKDLEPVFKEFEASPHPNIPIRKYMSAFMF